MSRNRRQQSTNTPMPDADSPTPEVLTEETEIIQEDAVESAAPVMEEAFTVSDTPPTPTSCDRKVLHQFLPPRIADHLDDTLWSAAVAAVKSGMLVEIITLPPFLVITDTKFNTVGDSLVGAPSTTLNLALTGTV